MKMMLVQLLALALLVGDRVSGYPQDRGLPDGATVPQQSRTGYEDSEAAASETGGAEEAYDDGDDSDMYMEPDGAESAHADARHEPEDPPPLHHQHRDESERPTMPHMTIVAVRPAQTSIQVTSSESTETSSSSSTPTASGQPEEREEERSLETDSQNFFPSFAELFGGPRLPFTEHQQQQQRYRPSRFLGYFQRDSRPYAVAASSAKEGHQPAILGSGNFGVIRGGTYYPEDKETDEYGLEDAPGYGPFYHGAGRARPSYYKNPKPQPVHGGDFFANFRDFADITAPPKSSFSHLSVVYANKNGSSAGRAPVDQPRNIIETLRMLEEEEEAGTTETPPQKKLSQGKRKLMKIKKYQDEKARKSRMTIEPLLALS
ncbi:uncharacterized protein LOC106638222 [Copidosoma floridanum]|uniref:uncharacterized protein LOC106638222 n=1 Tax=Copidosoma floridanum TaxID=29053 RepID=UPI0006C9A357|nr:uncharacterized protein LOC106638222 [Copidosoma floridanum]